MSAASDYLENELLDHSLGVASFAHAASVYLGFTTPTAEAVTFTNATNVVNRTAHGYSNGDPITFNVVPGSGDSLPTGLTAQQRYYVINANTNDFQVSLTADGSAVTFSDDGSGTINMYELLKEDMSNRASLEASTGGYARQECAFDAAASGSSSNTNAKSYAASAADFGDIVEWIVMDALTNGNCHFYGQWDVMRRILDGETFNVAAGALTVGAN